MGFADTFTVVLDVQPASDVVISVSSGDTGEVTVSPVTLALYLCDSGYGPNLDRCWCKCRPGQWQSGHEHWIVGSRCKF